MTIRQTTKINRFMSQIPGKCSSYGFLSLETFVQIDSNQLCDHLCVRLGKKLNSLRLQLFLDC